VTGKVTGRTTDDATGETAERPVLRVIRGDATPEEVAALLAVVMARAAAAPAARPRPSAAWNDHGRVMRAPVAPGPGAWRASAWPG
jgi:hypothetical protein